LKRTLEAVILGCAMLLAVPLAHAQRTEPIVNYENMEILPASGKTPSLTEVKAAIERAANTARGEAWEIAEVAPGKLVGTLNVQGKHSIRVNIVFNQSAYSVTYKDSVNMNYGPGAETDRDPADPRIIRSLPGNQLVIHANYNRWVKALVNNIRFETRKL
jgi:hypothetical protein